MSAFISSFGKAATIGGYEVRPISACSHYILKHVGCLLISPKEGESPDDNSLEMQFALMEFLYAHCAPVDEVAQACDITPEEWRKRVFQFGLTIPLDALEKAQRPIEQQAAAAANLAFDPQPEDSDLDPNDSCQTDSLRGFLP